MTNTEFKLPDEAAIGVRWPTLEPKKKRRQLSRKRKFRIELTPFEKELALRTMLRINLPGWPATGAYVLEKNNELKFVFGFACMGLHSDLPPKYVDEVFNRIEAAIKDIPQGEQVTFHLGGFSSDSERQTELRSLLENAPNDELKYLLMDEGVRVKALAKRGLREPKFLRIYVTYTIRKRTHGTRDWMEKILAYVFSFFRTLKGTQADWQNQKLKQCITRALTDGFQRCYQMVTNKMGLMAQPLSEVELWEILWRRFNKTDPIPIPQLLILDENGLREEIHSETHPVTLLVANGVPHAHREWTHVKDKYVGAYTFVSKPGGWPNKLEELRYLWQAIARDEIRDTEVFTQLTTANQGHIRTETQRHLKRSNVIAITANKNKSVDVAAEIKVRRSRDAQERMFEGESPVYASTIFLVHADDRDDLWSRSRYLEACFHAPAMLRQEMQYAWRLFLDTLPVSWHPQLVKPFDRRKVYLSSEIVGLLPLICTHPNDSRGVELIAEDGGSPIHIDLYLQHRSIGIFSETRGGKSTLLSNMITHALVRDIPAIVLDFPKPDGTSTFTDYTRYVKGSYFDISKERLNIFQIPDLTGLGPELQEERFEDYKDFLLALLVLIAGRTRDDTFNQLIRSACALGLNAFFSDPAIMERYRIALAEGIGTSEWDNTPTLKDFVYYLAPKYIDLSQIGGDTERALRHVETSIKAFVTTRVGRSISQPSSIRADAKLIVFALRGLNNDYDAAILSLAAYGFSKILSLKSLQSLLVIDEGPILFKWDDVAAVVAQEASNGAKAGKRLIVTAQNPDAISKSKYGSQILQNLSLRLIGIIQQTAIPVFHELFKIPSELLAINASKAFYPKRGGMYSRWLMNSASVNTTCRYYPGRVSLAVVANNPEEQQARNYFFEHFPDKFEALYHFSIYLETWIQQGKQPPLPTFAPKTSNHPEAA